MLERRPIWFLLIGLTVCISVWRISVQEPSMRAEYGYDSSVNNVAPAGAAASAIVMHYQVMQPQLQTINNNNSKSLIDIVEKNRKQTIVKLDERNSRSSGHNITTLHTDNNSSLLALRKFKIRPNMLQRKEINRRQRTYAKNVINNNYTSRSYRPSTLSLSAAYTVQQQQQQRQANNCSNKSSVETSRDEISEPMMITTTLQWYSQQQQQQQKQQYMHETTNNGRMTNISAIILPHNDLQQLIDLHNFEYLMQQPLCSINIAALIMVHSAPANYKKRLLIRETWAQRTLLNGTPLRLLFLLGAVRNQTLQQELHNENEIYKDMVQGNFIDDYRNLTYKHAMAFKWFIYNCANAQILIKVDDDVFVNTLQLLDYAKIMSRNRLSEVHLEEMRTSTAKQQRLIFNASTESNTHNTEEASIFVAAQRLFHHPQNLLFCKQQSGARVKRSFRSKWRVSVREYAHRYYPPYCPGYSIIYSPDVVVQLYKAAQQHKYFWIDDVHMTGTLAQLNNITITTSLPYTLSSEECERILNGKTDIKKREFLFAWSDITEQQSRALWLLNDMQHQKIATTSTPAAYLLYDHFR